MIGRLILGLAGVLAATYGGLLLLTRQDTEQLVNAASWLVAGVVLHDVVLALAVLGLVAVGARAVPRAARTPALVGLVVLGATTLLGIPVLGRFGARADNPTLLDRNYLAGWLVLAALVALGVVAATLVRSRRR